MPVRISNRFMAIFLGSLLIILLAACSESENNPPGPVTDANAPAEITNFQVDSIYQGTAWLSWTATGDDGNAGTATAYDLRYATDSVMLINDWDNTNAVVGLPTPQVSGSNESFELTGLSADTTFYLAIKARDDGANVSAISEIVTVLWTQSGQMIIPDLATDECANVDIPVMVNNFSEVAGLEIHIRYESQTMIYDSVTSVYLNDMITNADDSLVHIIWADINNLVQVPNGESLVVVHFSGLSGTGQMSFDAETQIVDYAGDPIMMDFTDGSAECTAK